MAVKNLLLRFAIVFAIYFAFQGGEYSTWDLYRQKKREEMLTRANDSLKHDVDSLKALKRSNRFLEPGQFSTKRRSPSPASGST